jgi:hypothetical protein
MQESSELMGLPVPREDYRADLDLLDRQAKLSAQLVGLAVLGVIGFLLGSAFDMHPRRAPLLWIASTILGYLSFVAALIMGIAHRYFALDLLQSLLRSLRLRNGAAPSADEGSMRREKKELREDARLVGRLLAGCTFGTALGVSCFTLRFVFAWFGL